MGRILLFLWTIFFLTPIVSVLAALFTLYRCLVEGVQLALDNW